MKSESFANNILAIQSERVVIEKMIKEYVGIVPAYWYDRLDEIEILLKKAK
jgi:hypothetical protein